jgi:hypothetical protein
MSANLSSGLLKKQASAKRRAKHCCQQPSPRGKRCCPAHLDEAKRTWLDSIYGPNTVIKRAGAS